MDGILLRIANTTQRQHDLILELRGLAQEFQNTIDDLENKTNELQRRFPVRSNLDAKEQAKQQKDPPYYDPQAPQANIAMSMGNIVSMPTTDDFSIPSQFKNGPIKRGD